ncbi:MAG TPA: hypothetical protein VM431_07535 [Phycisphaerae bacterium]|nr:hypothetical protein [Phycisphaerae bacterium]
MTYVEQLGRIAYTVIGPIVVLAGLGYLLGRRPSCTRSCGNR